MPKKIDAREELIRASAKLNSAITEYLFLIGDKIAKREKYGRDLSGLEAVYYYLIQKHNWFPAQVKAMNLEDLMLCVKHEKLD